MKQQNEKTLHLLDDKTLGLLANGASRKNKQSMLFCQYYADCLPASITLLITFFLISYYQFDYPPSKSGPLVQKGPIMSFYIYWCIIISPAACAHFLNQHRQGMPCEIRKYITICMILSLFPLLDACSWIYLEPRKEQLPFYCWKYLNPIIMMAPWMIKNALADLYHTRTHRRTFIANDHNENAIQCNEIAIVFINQALLCIIQSICLNLLSPQSCQKHHISTIYCSMSTTTLASIILPLSHSAWMCKHPPPLKMAPATQ